MEWPVRYGWRRPNCNLSVTADDTGVNYFSQDGDIAELNSASEFFCRERDSSRPLLVGSVKANLGHTLASGGLCSIIKVLIANKIGVIPPNLHYGEPNKSILGLLSGTMKVTAKR